MPVTNREISGSLSEVNSISGNVSVNAIRPEVFWATPGVTSDADIRAAHAAGKVVLCNSGKMVYRLVYVGNNGLRFAASNGDINLIDEVDNLWAETRISIPTNAYVKPSSGIPKKDLASAVRNSLDKADTALQSITFSDPENDGNIVISVV